MAASALLPHYLLGRLCPGWNNDIDHCLRGNVFPSAVIVVVTVTGVQTLGPEHQEIVGVGLVGVGDYALMDHGMVDTFDGSAMHLCFHNA